MKLFKLISPLGFSAFIATNTVQAVEKTTPSKQLAVKQAESQEKDVRLERFNKSVGIRFTERGLQSPNNQPVVTLTYSIENKGKNDIKSVHWISSYQVNNQAVYLRDIPINFEPSLPAGQSIKVTVNVPLAELPQQAQQFFTSKNANIISVNGAKNVTFTNGKRIVVAK